VLSSLGIVPAQRGKKGGCGGTSASAALEGDGEFGSRAVAPMQAVLCLGVPGTCGCQKRAPTEHHSQTE